VIHELFDKSVLDNQKHNELEANQKYLIIFMMKNRIYGNMNRGSFWWLFDN